MKPWEHGPLKISENKRYFMNGREPFFWLGDTAWLLFANVTEEEAYVYLKNRAEKGFNVILASLIHAMPRMKDVNMMHTRSRYDVCSEEYWNHCDRIISMAEELGLYMALLPSWGSIVKKKIITMGNVERYASFLVKRFGHRENVIWLLGGDINAAGYEEIYETLGTILKQGCTSQLIGFHPFGRCSSTMWFREAKWLDFNMFQSGHRRYDQCTLNAWDDKNDGSEYFGEDNWKYVKRDYELSDKPTLDGEPSYEWILQGLHDKTQPYWVAKDVRRYAYWSVLAGAAGHTYGDNSVMQFLSDEGVASYGAKEHWKAAIHHEGSGQMKYMKELLTSVDFINGKIRDDLLVGGQLEKYDRVAVFAGDAFVIAYSFTGKSFSIDVRAYKGAEAYYFKPSTGMYSYIGEIKDDTISVEHVATQGEDRDVVLYIKGA